MKPLFNHEMSECLQQVDTPPPMKPRDEFWKAFKARAALEGVRATAPAPVEFDRRWMWAATAGLAAAALLVLSLVIHGPQIRPTRGFALSKVEEVNVYVDYDTMLIVEDAENGGTLIWLAGVTPEPNRQGILQ